MKRSASQSRWPWRLPAVASVAFAGDDVTSLSYISYLERYATMQPAHGGETLDVVVNMPVLAGDRLDTSRGRTRRGAARRRQHRLGRRVLDPRLRRTGPLAGRLLARSRSSTWPEGTAAVEIPATAAGDGTMRLDSPAGTVFLNRPGLYRLELRGSEIRVQTPTAAWPSCRSASARRCCAAARRPPSPASRRRAEGRHLGPKPTTSGTGCRSGGTRPPRAGPRSTWTPATPARAAVLDSYGDWVYVQSFSSWMWRPRVSARLGAVLQRPLVLDVGGLDLDLVRAVGLVPVPLRLVVPRRELRLGLGLGLGVVARVGALDRTRPGYIGWCPRGYYDWWYYHNCTHCWGDGVALPGPLERGGVRLLRPRPARGHRPAPVDVRVRRAVHQHASGPCPPGPRPVPARPARATAPLSSAPARWSRRPSDAARAIGTPSNRSSAAIRPPARSPTCPPSCGVRLPPAAASRRRCRGSVRRAPTTWSPVFAPRDRVQRRRRPRRHREPVGARLAPAARRAR